MKIAAVACTLTACASVGLLKDREREAVATKNASIVLLRLVVTQDSKPVEFLKKLGGRSTVAIFVVNIDTGDQVSVTQPRTPTDASLKADWLYLVLEPGRYQLRMRAQPYNGMSGRFLLIVPPDSTVVYAGSLPVACDKPALPFATMNCSPPNIVLDERESAAQLVQTAFPEYGPFTTILMKGP